MTDAHRKALTERQPNQENPMSDGKAMFEYVEDCINRMLDAAEVDGVLANDTPETRAKFSAEMDRITKEVASKFGLPDD